MTSTEKQSNLHFILTITSFRDAPKYQAVKLINSRTAARLKIYA